MKKIGRTLIVIAAFIFAITMSNGPGTTNPEEDAQLAAFLLLASTIFLLIGLLFLILYGFYQLSKKIFLPLVLSFWE